MSSNETAAYKIMRSLDVDYVLVIFGGVIGYSGDDINKFLWMVRIAEGEHPKDIRVRNSFRCMKDTAQYPSNSLMVLIVSFCVLYKSFTLTLLFIKNSISIFSVKNFWNSYPILLFSSPKQSLIKTLALTPSQCLTSAISFHFHCFHFVTDPYDPKLEIGQ